MTKTPDAHATWHGRLVRIFRLRNSGACALAACLAMAPSAPAANSTTKPIRTVSEVDARGREVIARYTDPQLAAWGFLDVSKPPYSADPIDPAKLVPMVFDRMDAYCGAAPIADHDFSSYGFGATRRMTNFLPRYPHGLIGIVPDDIEPKTFPRMKEKITTDGRWFYDGDRAIAPADYKRVAIAKLEAAAARLPVRVNGEVAWSVVRLDPRHVRVALIDAGYVDPADRNVDVILQRLDATRCTDILSGKTLPIRHGRCRCPYPRAYSRSWTSSTADIRSR